MDCFILRHARTAFRRHCLITWIITNRIHSAAGSPTTLTRIDCKAGAMVDQITFTMGDGTAQVGSSYLPSCRFCSLKALTCPLTIFRGSTGLGKRWRAGLRPHYLKRWGPPREDRSYTCCEGGHRPTGRHQILQEQWKNNAMGWTEHAWRGASADIRRLS